MSDAVSRDEELAALVAEQQRDDDWGHRVDARGLSLDYTLDSGASFSDVVGTVDANLVQLNGDAELFTRRGKKRSWSKRAVLGSIRRWHKNFGRAPYFNEWRSPGGQGFPSSATVTRRFGSWNAAIQAAGFEPTPHGGPKAVIHGTRLRRRVRPPKRTAFLTPAQVSAAFVIYEREGLSIPQLAERLWRAYGYRSTGSCRTALLRAFHAEGFRVRTKREAWAVMSPERRARIHEQRARSRAANRHEVPQ